MLVATFAKRIGKTVAFALAAYRQAFAGGRALSVRDNVLIAAAACEIHPNALLRAAATRGVREELERESALAGALGVDDVPAVRVGDRVLVGEARARARRDAAGHGARMRAGVAYRLLVRRGGATPAVLASPERVDHVEVVDVGSGEVVLFWDCRPREASRLARALRADLASAEVEEFLDRWTAQSSQ